ncbi:MAG: minor capsid protein [Nitrospinae bacterium]|nr:minor capsid protein [Nitrospinota bacterium]
MPSSNEKLHDELLEQSVANDRTAEGVALITLALLLALEKKLIAEFISLELTIYQRYRLKKFLEKADRSIKKTYVEIKSTIEKNLLEIAVIEKTAVKNAINTAMDLDISSVSVDKKGVKSLVDDTLIAGLPLGKWLQEEVESTRMAISGAVRHGMAVGESAGQITKRITLTSAARKRNAKTLALTSTAVVTQSARIAAYEEDSDLIGFFYWLSVLDSRTTPQCMALSGLRWTLDKKPIGHKKPWGPPPIHMRCRSTIIPVLKSWDDLPNAKKQSIDAKTRRLIEKDHDFRGMDGQAPATVDYETWLKSKSEIFQKTTLGKSRYEMWKTGDIIIKDLIDNSQRPLTVAQLRDLVDKRNSR